MAFILVLSSAIVVLAVLDLSSAEGKGLRVEIGRLVLSSFVVFISVYSAQYLNNDSQNKRDIEHITNLLYATHIEVENFNDYLGLTLNSYWEIKKKGRKITPLIFYKSNPVKLPIIVDTVLSDTNLLRVMHPQSISGIFTALENSNRALDTLNNEDIAESELKETVLTTQRFIRSLLDFIAYEIEYQSGNIGEEQLFELHRSVIDSFKTSPVKSEVKKNN